MVHKDFVKFSYEAKRKGKIIIHYSFHAIVEGFYVVKNIINILLWAIGIVSVIMLIIGGFRYVTSNGDSSQVTAAKNTIMYSVIGLIIAIFAYAIVNFVVFRVGGIAVTDAQKAQQAAAPGS